MVDTVVAHGVVEPDVCLALDLVVDPGHVALVYHVHDAVAGPHDVDVAVHDAAECRQVYAVSPSAVVLCGADDAWVHVRVCLLKFGCNIVHEFGLLVAVCTVVVPEVVPEYGKCPYAELAHCLELVYDVVPVGLVPLDVLARVDGPHELNLVCLGGVHIACDLCGKVCGILLAPFALVVCVILRAVDVDVHLLASEHLEESHTVLLAVGVAVVALYKTALWYIGVVGHGGAHHVGLRCHLQECLHSVECTAAVIAGNYYLAFLHCKVITLGLLRDEVLICGNGLVATLSHDDLDLSAIGVEAFLEQVYGIGISSGFSRDAVACTVVESDLLSPLDFLRNGVDVNGLCL